MTCSVVRVGGELAIVCGRARRRATAAARGRRGAGDAAPPASTAPQAELFAAGAPSRAWLCDAPTMALERERALDHDAEAPEKF